MHIVFYISRFGIGGIQTFVIQLAKELLLLPNVKVSIFCHYPELVDASLNESIPPEIEVLTLSKNRQKVILINKMRNWIKKLWPSFDYKEWLTQRYFLRILKEKKVDLIHNNIEIGDYNVFLAQQQLGIPYITTLHGAYKGIAPNIDLAQKEQQKLVFERLFSTATNIVYLSPANLKPFEIVLGDLSQKQWSFVRIFNGLKKVERPLMPEGEHTIVFGLIARGVHYKGWEEAILATMRLVKKYPHKKVILKLYGSSDYLNELAQKYKASKDFVLFCGPTTKPLEVVQAFTVGLLPTYLPQEEMPFTIIEYLACGKPVIATPKGAIPEMLEIEGEVAGEIVPFGKDGRADVVMLEKAMEQFVIDARYQAQKALLAQKAFEKFDIKNTVKQYYNLYQKALKI